MHYALQHVSDCSFDDASLNMPRSGKKEYRVITRIKNNLILSAIEAAGYTSVSHFAETVKVSACTIGELINFKYSPLNRNGEWRPCVYAICEALNKMPSQLFTEKQTQLVDAKIKVTEVSEAEALWAIEFANEDNPHQHIEKQELNTALYQLLDRLPSRVKEIISLYYGLNGESMSYPEIAKKFNVSCSRVQQVHKQAILILKSRRNSDCMRQVNFLRSA